MWCVLSYVCHVHYACHVSYACHVRYALDPSLALVRSLDVTCQACESTGVPLGDVLVSMRDDEIKYFVQMLYLSAAYDNVGVNDGSVTSEQLDDDLTSHLQHGVPLLV